MNLNLRSRLSKSGGHVMRSMAERWRGGVDVTQALESFPFLIFRAQHAKHAVLELIAQGLKRRSVWRIYITAIQCIWCALFQAFGSTQLATWPRL
jgi:hypothetical protein